MGTAAGYNSSPPTSTGTEFGALVRNLRLSFILLAFLFFSTAETVEISYTDHCNSTVPESVTTSLSTSVPTSYFQFDLGSFSGADEILPSSSYNTFRFSPVRRMYNTRSPGVFSIEASLYLYGPPMWLMNGTGRRLLRLVNDTVPWVNRRRVMIRFSLKGFWSEVTGKVCMVGTGWSRGTKGAGNFDFSAIFKLPYFPKSSNLTNVVVRGSLESLDVVGSKEYFSPVKMLVYAPHDYKYSLINKTESFLSDQLEDVEERIGFDGYQKPCDLLNTLALLNGFQLKYASGCQGKSCSPFVNSVGYSPKFMFLNDVKCSEGRLHLYMTFSNNSTSSNAKLIEPELMFVAEGLWDSERNLLKMVTCSRMLSSNKTESTGDCTMMGVVLWFPKYLSLTNRAVISGRILSSQDWNSPGYFQMISFHDTGDYTGSTSGRSYKYTQVEKLQKTCSSRSTGKSGRKTYYPGPNSPWDMRFDISVVNANGEYFFGAANPLSLGQTLYENFPMTDAYAPLPEQAERKDESLWNVSYVIKYNDGIAYFDISAEGIYNTDTGDLCMMGCLSSSSKLNSTDCSVTVAIQLSSLQPGKDGEHTNGTIKSTRQKSDSLYFKPLEISSYGMYAVQVEETISRMDIEIMMVLVSLTLMCVITGFQLFHLKKHPHVLPSVSLTMLVVLTVGHMVPLVTNFEAFITSRNKHSSELFQSSRWQEAKETSVRVVTMIAFLLQCRLLQLSWSSRTAETKNFKTGETRTVQLCLPLYLAGALTTWLVHLHHHHTRSQNHSPPESAPLEVSNSSLWKEMLSYTGLLLDGFLLPQITMNLFSNSKEKSLAVVFYVGATVVRAMPHLYDAYRGQQYVPFSTIFDIYGSTDEDLYSPAWDIVIPCGGVLFAFILYLQQRFGSTCILPSRLRDNNQAGGYEMVPVVDS